MPAAFDTCTCGHSYVHHIGARAECFCGCPAFKENGASLARRGLLKLILEENEAPSRFLVRFHSRNGAPCNASAATPEEALSMALAIWRNSKL